ncbi:MAG: amidohydrolase family protein [Actinomycetota bacterium]
MTRAAVVDTHAHYWQPSASEVVNLAATDQPIDPASFVMLMDSAGVSRLLQVTRYFDTDDYSLAGAAAHPTRFRVLGKFQHSMLTDPGSLAAWSARNGVVGLRVFTIPAEHALYTSAADGFWSTAESLRLPISIYAPGFTEGIARVATAHPDLRIVLDHAGTNVMTATPPEHRFEEWDATLELAAVPNIFVKASALPEATGESFPYPRAQERLHALCTTFGANRVMWGSNYTPAARAGSYEQLTEFARLAVAPLTEPEQHSVLTGTAGRFFELIRWIEGD